MLKETKEKLAQIDELFPEERLEKSRERWRRLWAGEKPLDRLPFMASPVGIDYYNVTPSQTRLQDYLDASIARGRFEDDFIPSFFPGCRQGTIPNMFGAPEVVIGEDYTCEHLMTDYEQIVDLPAPRIAPGSVAEIWLDMERYVLEETESRFPVHVTDMQGPMDVAGQLLGYDQVYIAAYEEPELYAKLMAATTDAFTMLWRAQHDLLGDAFIGTHLFGWNYLPKGFGVTASIDSLVMVSSAFYQEFFQPYVERIGEEFGGVTVHSCGDFSGVVPGLMQTKGLRGVNAGQMTLVEMAQAGIDGRVVIIGMDHMNAIEKSMRFIKDGGLRADLTIHGVWPEENGKLKPSAMWTAADWDAIDRKNEVLLKLFRG